MSQEVYTCCILGSNIPPGNEIITYTPNGDTRVFDLYTLAKSWVLNGKLENPLTRQPLSPDQETRIREYKRVTITLPDAETIYISGVAPVWLAIATIVSGVCGSTLDCIQFDVLTEDRSLYSMNLQDDIWDLIGSSCSVSIHPHKDFPTVRVFVDVLASQQEPKYRELATEMRIHLRRGVLTRKPK